ncbi:hypothetical protein BA895_04200 [Humibacillus sp. DSM 29435]|uniref:hypothetical protein n=1 Tax=Humibacillus sp. DSM 29435 TaxID=1869167 RepID=UPI000872C413|nr:hypothetical protein [Humibacillus sp. DSM 29435]OFE16775.1 hypothetical protein BA895_04200 [Humibacillus sp. DSM 29435]
MRHPSTSTRSSPTRPSPAVHPRSPRLRHVSPLPAEKRLLAQRQPKATHYFTTGPGLAYWSSHVAAQMRWLADP